MAKLIPRSDPTANLEPLCLQDARLLLENNYLPFEAGCAFNADGMCHVAASTYMPGVTGEMLDWWFGWIHNTDQYKLWHPRDHVFSDWEGPRGNTSLYIGGHHLVHEYIGGVMSKLKISFHSPANYFGPNFESDFKKYGYSTAICGRVGIWDDLNNTVTYTGHLIHLIKDEPDGCRMRSRFWLGDIDGITDPAVRASLTPPHLGLGLCKHATEEMSILASILPGLFEKHSRKAKL
ncbi:Phloretin hydrolase [Venturia nashicola]|uniref:Phloretin hydrolase n=1 Tax=Venturia nashicola TaxID=86259 RepID=A0A4Z1P6I0_9PEZI|nr:Phloretin hydrolase [Venturia nashicola]TLD26319.1 Phloretin hydrolase [Venturia nashicola]